MPIPGRLPTWSAGGADGRALLDPFLEGLAAHLAPGGRAVITHNAFVGLERSREIVARAAAWRSHRADDAGLYCRRQARADDAGRAARRGRPLDPPLRPLRLRRDAHRRDRRRPRRSADEAAVFVPPGAGVRGACSRMLRRCTRSRRSPDAALARAAEGGARHAAGRLHAAQCRPTDPHPVRRAHPRRRARLLSAVRHPRPARRARATSPTSRWRSAAALGVEVEFVRVNAATRIPLLAEDRIDLAIATMGHNTQRDGQVRFIRPHYYQSETTLVGPQRAGDPRLEGHCRPHDLRHRRQRLERRAGVAQSARLMLFDEAGVLPDRLKDETCTLAAQDDSFFAYYFTDPAFAARFEQKFGFAQVPWGMAVARDRQRQACPRARPDQPDLPSRRHVPRDRAASTASAPAFLEQPAGRLAAARLQHRRGQHQRRLRPAAARCRSCKPTPFAGSVDAFEDWFEKRLGHRPHPADAQDRAGLVAVPERRRQFADPDRRRAGRDACLRDRFRLRAGLRLARCCAGRRAWSR